MEDVRITRHKEKYVDTYKRGTSINKIFKLIGKGSRPIIGIKLYRDRGRSQKAKLVNR